MENNTKLMQWKRTDDSSNASGLSLHLTVDGHNWYEYTNPKFSHLRQSELKIEGASKGYSTATYCLKLGFKYIPTDN